MAVRHASARRDEWPRLRSGRADAAGFRPSRERVAGRSSSELRPGMAKEERGEVAAPTAARVC